jgi:hypothetical protein
VNTVPGPNTVQIFWCKTFLVQSCNQQVFFTGKHFHPNLIIDYRATRFALEWSTKRAHNAEMSYLKLKLHWKKCYGDYKSWANFKSLKRLIKLNSIHLQFLKLVYNLKRENIIGNDIQRKEHHS